MKEDNAQIQSLESEIEKLEAELKEVKKNEEIRNSSRVYIRRKVR